MSYDDNQRALHILFMKEILLTINSKNYPTYLKGGTALLLCYGLDRFSEDIDLDSEKSFNLENTIRTASNKLGITIDSINLPKDTETTKRYKVHYNKNMYLKIETSFRNTINSNDVTVIDDIRVYKPNIILDMKFLAIGGDRARTKARDLHDVIFLANRYGDSLTEEQAKKLIKLSKDIDRLLTFEDDYKQDSILHGEFDNDYYALEKVAHSLKNRNIIAPKEEMISLCDEDIQMHPTP